LRFSAKIGLAVWPSVELKNRQKRRPLNHTRPYMEITPQKRFMLFGV